MRAAPGRCPRRREDQADARVRRRRLRRVGPPAGRAHGAGGAGARAAEGARPRGTDGRPLRLTVAGRTDRGVHAWGQVASYAHEALDPVRLNGLIGDDVSVLAANPSRRSSTPGATRARAPTAIGSSRGGRAACSSATRAYWWTGGTLDRELLAACAAALVGAPRLHGLHADRNRTHVVQLHRRERRVARPR